MILSCLGKNTENNVAELDFTIMIRGAASHAHFSQLLEQFESQSQIHVRPRFLTWEEGWAEIVKIALDGQGPDISEVGSTWVGSLAAMNALRAFTPADVAAFGGAEAFMPAAWRTGMLNGDPPVWAMPWLGDTRVLYYRRDWLQQAGIPEQDAFQTHQQLEATVARLQANGIALPWVMATRRALNALHLLASWVWGAGGHFFSSDDRQVAFNEPAARAAIQHYFSFRRFLAPAAQGLDGEQCETLYRTGQAAVCITGPWLYETLEPAVKANTGIAPAPGVAFVGGSNLVIWRHSKHEHERGALSLVRFLTQQSTQIALNRLVGLLPIRKDVLELADFAQHPLYQAVTESLKNGRSFPKLAAWALIEARLAAEMDEIWADILARPDLELEATIAPHLESLARRLNLTLASKER